MLTILLYIETHPSITFIQRNIFPSSISHDTHNLMHYALRFLSFASFLLTWMQGWGWGYVILVCESRVLLLPFRPMLLQHISKRTYTPGDNIFVVAMYYTQLKYTITKTMINH